MKLRVNELSSELGESAHVIRNWIKEFRTFIPIEKAENGYNLFPPEAVEVFKTIQRLHRQQGFSTRQIEHFLAGTGGEEVAAAAEVAAPAAATSAEVAELKAMIAALSEQQRKQEEFNRELLNRLEQRDKVITEYITERRQLMLEEQQKPQEEPPKPKPWYKRMF
ncbi:helix-turn-helix domain-containing protein [Paenibacillus sp. MMO-177]|uniref:helix-turn-helix domain-containing protein n=1 Tax=Paenibacillus sp. MMO-177 TaxID=3081289 RepID=UPI00301822A2